MSAADALGKGPEMQGHVETTDLAEVRRAELDLAWRQFGTATDPDSFCRNWLALQCHAIAAVADAVVVLQRPGTETFAPLAFWPDARRDRSHLTEITERVLREGRGIVQPVAGGKGAPDRPDYQIAYPVRLDGKVRGVVGLQIDWREAAQLQAAMRQLQWGSGWLEVLLRRHADPVEAARLRIKLILQLVSTFLDRPSFHDAATELATEMASQLGCDRVVLGLAQGSAIRVEAVSHTSQFDRHSNLLTLTTAAMAEALDQREAIVYPRDREGRAVVTLAHAELGQAVAAGGIVTVPILHGERAIGALTLARAPGLEFDAPAVELLQGLAAMLGSLIEMRLAQQRGLAAHAADSARGLGARLFGPRHAGFKLGAIVLAALAAFLALAVGEYRISADARIEGAIQRAVTAPFQGYVRETRYRAGDTVKQGELLARLDERDLRLEEGRLEAQRDQYGRQYREAMAKRDRAVARIISAQIEQIEAQLALIGEQLSRTEIVAPFDGVLVSGDLTQALGAPLERGQVLFEIAPLDAYRIMLQVDEHKVADVAIGQKGELVLSSMPGERFPFTVNQITPVSVAKEGRNYFRVEARLDGDAGRRLRPGMEGIAKISAGERGLAWIWTRDLAGWIRLKSWAWMP